MIQESFMEEVIFGKNLEKRIRLNSRDYMPSTKAPRKEHESLQGFGDAE